MTSFKGKHEGTIYLEESSRQRWDNQSLSETEADLERDDDAAEYCEDDDNSSGLGGFECFHFLYFHIVFVPETKSGPVDMQHIRKRIGFIKGDVVDRDRISKGYFYEYMDAHSCGMQWLSVTMFENDNGRTVLPSLAPYDAYGRSFTYISQLSITDPEFHTDREEIETITIHQLLNLPYICQEHPVTSAYCLLHDVDLYELRNRKPTNEPYRYCKQSLRQNANAYLRNGFFQDPVYMTKSDNARFLVAKYPDWKRPPFSHEQAAQIRLFFGRESVKQSLDRPRLEYTSNSCIDSSDDDNEDYDDDYNGEDDEDSNEEACRWGREITLYADVIYWGIRENITWENICDLTASNILAHMNPKSMEELRALTGVVDESMIQTYGERILKSLRSA